MQLHAHRAARGGATARRIYLSRSDVWKRHIANEKDADIQVDVDALRAMVVR